MKIIADTNIPLVKECFSSLGRVDVVPGRAITNKLLTDADILLVRSITKVNAELLKDTSIRFVATATIGTDHIDTDFLTKNNIGFASAPGSNANSVAEYIIAAILQTAKKHNIILSDSSIGIIGVGNVGSAVAKKAAALGMKTFLNDPPLQRKTNDPKYQPLENLFDCDFITVHTPLTLDGPDKTYHLCDQNFFSSLKPAAVFLNTSRGKVVDNSAIKSANLRSIVLDVWENEPEIDTELLKMVDIATPHIAGYSTDGKIAGMIMIYNAACNYFNLKPDFDTKSFLPAPAIKQLTIDPAANTEQENLTQTVEKIYDIKQDDKNLRQALTDPDTVAKQFDLLRKNYPVRREFQNTRIILQTPSKSLTQKLSGIGFEAEHE